MKFTVLSCAYPPGTGLFTEMARLQKQGLLLLPQEAIQAADQEEVRPLVHPAVARDLRLEALRAHQVLQAVLKEAAAKKGK